MDLRNWEMYVNTGLPVIGAAVTCYVASLIQPNPGAVVQSTVTNSDGMWSFTGLADTNVYDVKVEYLGKIKWIKGLAKHAISGFATELDTTAITVVDQSSDPAAPASGRTKIFTKTDGVVYTRQGPSGIRKRIAPYFRSIFW